MMQKVRNQAFPCGHSPLPACRHTISGSLNSPHRGSFHLSLAVLVHYRSTGSIQACEMVLADSGRIARVPPYLGTPLGQSPVSTTGLSPSVARLSRRLVYRELVLNAVPQPRRSFLRRFSLLRFRSPLLAESRLLSFPRGTEMFHFPRFARSHLCIQCGVRRHYPPWVSPFGHRRIKAWLAAPRRFSQLPTSFFASCRLGIHRVPFVAWSFFSSIILLPIDEDQGPARWGQPPRKTATLAYLRICDFQRTRNLTAGGRQGAPSPAHHVPGQVLVEPIGIEPTTSSLQSWRSPS
jgi:hypothetical protein